MIQPTTPCHSNPYIDASSPWPPPSHPSTGDLICANATGTQICCFYLNQNLHIDNASLLGAQDNHHAKSLCSPRDDALASGRGGYQKLFVYASWSLLMQTCVYGSAG
jgi:hypothetical protein